MQCQKRKRDGKRCEARALSGRRWCAFHADPSRASKLGRRGGRRRAVRCPQELKVFDPPKSAADLRDLLSQSIIELRTGTLDPKLANSISYLGTGFLKAIEASETESRLDAIERAQRLDRQQLDAARRDLEGRVSQGDTNRNE